MGIGIRVFLFSDDNSIKRLPLTIYERLLQRDPNEHLLQYAGKRVRFAEMAPKTGYEFFSNLTLERTACEPH